MQTNELYRRYLLADRLSKLGRKIGTKVVTSQLHDIGDYWRKPENGDRYIGYVADVTVTLTTWELKEPEEREAAALAWLEALPELNLHRANGYMYLWGYVQGLRVEMSVGEGVCERVKVGTRVVPATAEYVEDVFEVRCPDPILSSIVQ